MASISFSVVMSDGTTMQQTAAVSDADVGRLLAVFATRYKPADVIDANGVRSPGVADGPFLVSKWIEDVVVTAMNFVRGVESAAAAKAASDNVQMIPFTLA